MHQSRFHQPARPAPGGHDPPDIVPGIIAQRVALRRNHQRRGQVAVSRRCQSPGTSPRSRVCLTSSVVSIRASAWVKQDPAAKSPPKPRTDQHLTLPPAPQRQRQSRRQIAPPDCPARLPPAESPARIARQQQGRAVLQQRLCHRHGIPARRRVAVFRGGTIASGNRVEPGPVAQSGAEIIVAVQAPPLQGRRPADTAPVPPRRGCGAPCPPASSAGSSLVGNATAAQPPGSPAPPPTPWRHRAAR